MIISVDQICVAVEQTLTLHLPGTIASPAVQAYLGARVDQFQTIKEWQQVPTIEALSAASLPAGAIASPGLASPPARVRSSREWECTWRIAIGIYDRGRDHAETQGRVRDWCAFIRATLLDHPSLGGVAKRITWVGEEYAKAPARNQARTIAAGAVAIDVTTAVPDHLSIGVLPTVQTTHPTLVVTPPQ